MVFNAETRSTQRFLEDKSQKVIKEPRKFLVTSILTYGGVAWVEYSYPNPDEPEPNRGSVVSGVSILTKALCHKVNGESSRLLQAVFKKAQQKI